MMRTYGITKEVAKCSVRTIVDMQHRIRTVFGDSDILYGGTEQNSKPHHGNGQGNGNGPAVLAAISSPLLNILRNEGYGVELTSPNTGFLFKLSAFSLVDDMDYIQTGSHNESPAYLLAKTQRGVTLWESLL